MDKPFRYSLEALLRKRNWDLDALRQEERETYALVESQFAICEELQAQKRDVEAEIRASSARHSDIQPEMYTALRTFLTEKREALSVANTRLDEVKETHAEIMERVLAAKQSVRTLERHRDTKEAEYRIEQERAVIKQSDELWLLRRGGVGDES